MIFVTEAMPIGVSPSWSYKILPVSKSTEKAAFASIEKFLISSAVNVVSSAWEIIGIPAIKKRVARPAINEYQI